MNICFEKESEGWKIAPDNPFLKQSEIHLYRCRLSCVSEENVFCTLSGPEKERADRFGCDQFRHRFIASHICLRHILAVYSKTVPERLKFSHNNYGKPYLSNDTSLWFNLAHSGDMALIAVTRIGEIGVDVEQLRTMSQAADIADRYFHIEEKKFLQKAANAVFPALFLSIWTKKEACIKAVGRGLTQSLAAFNVVGDNPIVVPERNGYNSDKKSKLMLAGFQPHRDYLGAVAVEGGAYKLSRFTWQP